MTWPTTTTTDSLDFHADNPRSARLEILKNIQDTNSIIGEFGSVDLASAANGKVFGYTGSAWQPQSNFLNAQTIVQLTAIGGGYGAGTSFSFTGSDTFTQTADLIELSDAQSNFNSSVVSAGTYYMEVEGFWASAVDAIETFNPGLWTMSPSVVIRNETTSTDLLSISSSMPPTESMDLAPDAEEIDLIHWASGAAQVTFAADSTISATLKLAVTNSQGTTKTGYYWLGSHLLMTLTEL